MDWNKGRMASAFDEIRGEMAVCSLGQFFLLFSVKRLVLSC